MDEGDSGFLRLKSASDDIVSLASAESVFVEGKLLLQTALCWLEMNC